jgi:hypothetical protein
MYNNRGIIRETQTVRVRVERKEKKENHQRQEEMRKKAAEHHP